MDFKKFWGTLESRGFGQSASLKALNVPNALDLIASNRSLLTEQGPKALAPGLLRNVAEQKAVYEEKNKVGNVNTKPMETKGGGQVSKPIISKPTANKTTMLQGEVINPWDELKGMFPESDVMTFTKKPVKNNDDVEPELIADDKEEEDNKPEDKKEENKPEEKKQQTSIAELLGDQKGKPRGGGKKKIFVEQDGKRMIFDGIPQASKHFNISSPNKARKIFMPLINYGDTITIGNATCTLVPLNFKMDGVSTISKIRQIKYR